MKKLRSNPSNLQIVFEDNHIIIINKRAGDIVQGDKTGDDPLSEIVKSYIKEKYNKPGNVYLGVVHRLDRPTTGLVMFSKTSKALSRLNKMLAERDISKTYWAVVQNKPEKEQDQLVHWLQKNKKKNKAIAFSRKTENSKKAILSYNLKKSLDNYHLLEIKLETGRHHQIRAQLSRIGCPIKGDLKYGAPRSNEDGSIHLHARKIKFIHPVSKELMSFEADVPDDTLWRACED